MTLAVSLIADSQKNDSNNRNCIYVLDLHFKAQKQ